MDENRRVNNEPVMWVEAEAMRIRVFVGNVFSVLRIFHRVSVIFSVS